MTLPLWSNSECISAFPSHIDHILDQYFNAVTKKKECSLEFSDQVNLFQNKKFLVKFACIVLKEVIYTSNSRRQQKGKRKRRF